MSSNPPIILINNYLLPEVDRSRHHKFVIFDLDGVLCHVSPERRALLDEKRYDEHNLMGTKEPLAPMMVELAQRCVLLGHEVIVLTARDGQYAAGTAQQLMDGRVPFRALGMRGVQNYEWSDERVKEELFTNFMTLYNKHSEWSPMMAIYDRITIIRLWERLGVPALMYSADNTAWHENVKHVVT